MDGPTCSRTAGPLRIFFWPRMREGTPKVRSCMTGSTKRFIVAVAAAAAGEEEEEEEEEERGRGSCQSQELDSRKVRRTVEVVEGEEVGEEEEGEGEGDRMEGERRPEAEAAREVDEEEDNDKEGRRKACCACGSVGWTEEEEGEVG